MLQAFTITLNQMLQILLLLVLGYGINKLHLISREAEGVLSRFVSLLFIPSMSLYSNMMECKLSSLAAYSSWVLYGLLFYGSSILLSYPLARRFARHDSYQQGVYRYALSIPNTGAVATPLMQALYGTAGVFQFGLFTFTGSVLTYSWGIGQLQPSHGKTTLWQNLRKCINVNSIAMVIGMALGLLGASEWMPGFIAGTVRSLYNCYVPVALLLTGFSIADYPVGQVFHDKKLYLYTFYRLIFAPLVFLGILYLLKAPLMVATMAAITVGAPCGMNIVVYPAAYGQDCSRGASMVLVSSIGAMVTVPLLYAVTQMLFGGI